MKRYDPEFSIIIPVYNTVHELPRCINSILEQKYQEFELILVDDGSSDGSGDLCDKYAYNDPRIISIHKENGGVSEARNTGVKASKGEYLLFVDSDDMWNNVDALTDLNKIVQDNPGIDLICFGTEIIDENGKIEKIRKLELPEDINSDKETVIRNLIFTNQYFSAPYVKALRREYFINNNLFFTKGLLSEDIEWSFRVLVSCKDIKVYPKVFYKRIRRNEGSLTAAIGKDNIIAILDSIENGIILIEESGLNTNLKDLYFEYWAYQYAMLFVLLKLIEKDKDYLNIIKRMKKLKWLLRYDHVGKVRAVGTVCKIFGVKGTVNILGIYYRLKSRRGLA